MKRPSRSFFATVSELEGRALQATLAPAAAEPPPDYVVGFGMSPLPPHVFSQAISQQTSGATVILSRNKLWARPGELPPLQVRVETDPTSPYVGVNVGAVDQTVTFAPGQNVATLTVPIIAGAPNPGEVAVNLTMTPIAPPPDLELSVSVLSLRILASDESVPPAIVATNGTPLGIELVFNKSMAPVQASNVKNYTAISSWLEPDNDLIPSMGSMGKRVSRDVPLRSAVYNAATNTVTLIPRRPLNFGGPNGLPFNFLFVTPGRRANAAGGRNAGMGAANVLADLAGHPIHQSAKPPGKFRVSVSGGFRSIYPNE